MSTEQLQQEEGSVVPNSAGALLQRLDEEIALLREAMAKIDPNSRATGDLWAIPIYQKIIKRRKRLAEYLDAN
jgi:hypothetical protein